MNPPAPTASVPVLTPPTVAVPAGASCENCGNEVTQRYCGACGQRLDAPVHTLWHFCQVAAEDLTHADSRLWRTLAALLFRPGFLTREFLAGRRARYLPPVRLYLVLSVVFFLFAAATQSKLTLLELGDDHPPRAYVAGAAEPDAAATATVKPKAGTSAPIRDLECKDVVYSGPFTAQIAPLATRACQKIRTDNGRSLQESFLHNLPRAMFVFLPLLAGIMALLYWRPRRYYVEHLLLLVHNHAFVFLAVMLAWVVGLPFGGLPSVLKFALGGYVLWYMYRSMRVAYGQGRLLTGSKLVLLLSFYMAFGALMLAATTLYSAITL